MQHYAEEFATRITRRPPYTPDRWARVVYEDAPKPLRAFLRFGWRAGLGLRLGAPGSAEHVLGWRIAEVEEDAIRLATSSPLLDAELILHNTAEHAVITSKVRLRRPVARPLWAAALPLHRRLIPLMLRQAVRRAGVAT